MMWLKIHMQGILTRKYSAFSKFVRYEPVKDSADQTLKI